MFRFRIHGGGFSTCRRLVLPEGSTTAIINRKLTEPFFASDIHMHPSFGEGREIFHRDSRLHRYRLAASSEHECGRRSRWRPQTTVEEWKRACEEKGSNDVGASRFSVRGHTTRRASWRHEGEHKGLSAIREVCEAEKAQSDSSCGERRRAAQAYLLFDQICAFFE